MRRFCFCADAEGGEFAPVGVGGRFDVGCVAGFADVVGFGFGVDEEVVGFAEAPVEVDHALAAGAFAAEAFDAGFGRLVEEFDAVFGFDGVGVVAFGGVPDGEDGDFAVGAKLLDAEVAGVPAANHEVAAVGGFFDDGFVVEGVALGVDEAEVDGAGGAWFGGVGDAKKKN